MWNTERGWGLMWVRGWGILRGLKFLSVFIRKMIWYVSDINNLSRKVEHWFYILNTNMITSWPDEKREVGVGLLGRSTIPFSREREGERGRQTDRQRQEETEGERQRERERKRQRQTDRQRGKEGDRHRHRDRERDRERQTDRQTETEKETYTDKDRQT